MDSILVSRPATPGSILSVPKIFSDEILDVVEIYRQRALLRQWTVQSFIVDGTHPVLVRTVLQKIKLSTTRNLNGRYALDEPLMSSSDTDGWLSV